MAKSTGPIRVLTVVDALGRGGAERLIVSLDEHLNHSRFVHSVVCLYGPNPLARELESRGTVVTCLQLPGPAALPRAVRLLRGEVKSFHPHIVHTHLFSANIAGRLAARGRARVLTTLHNPDYGSDGGEGWRFFIRSFLDRITGQLFTSRFLAVSEHVRDDYRVRMGFEGIDVLYNSADLKQLSDQAAGIDRRQSREALDIDADAFVVLHVGRLHRQKAQDVLVSAFARLRQRVPSARLILVGAGPLQAAIQQQVASAGLADSVSLPGQVADVVPFLVGADAFAFPSRFEAFGIALLEAMAVGLPSVVTRISGIDEVADATTSLFVAPDDERQLAAALERLQVDTALAARLSAGARSRARVFDVTTAVHRIEEVYEAEARLGGWNRA